MKKITLIAAMLLAIAASAQKPEHTNCDDTANCNRCDSVNMPVYIVDGVEVMEISGIDPEDIVKVEVIKDPAITKIFSPRLGGVVLITTKSKRFLAPILENFKKKSEEQRQQRTPGELRIR